MRKAKKPVGGGPAQRRSHQADEQQTPEETATAVRQFGDRLRRLMQARGLKRRDLLIQCGLSSPRLTGYLGKHVVPRGDAVARIAAEYNVSCDWLLLGVGGDGPVYRSLTRGKASLASDLGAYVAGAVADAVNETPPFPDERYTRWTADGDGLLDIAVRMSVESFVEWRRWERAVAEAKAIHVAQTTPSDASGAADSDRGAGGRRRAHVRYRAVNALLSPETQAALSEAIRVLQHARPRLSRLARPERVIPVQSSPTGVVENSADKSQSTGPRSHA